MKFDELLKELNELEINCSNEQLNQQSNNRGNGSESLGWHIISILSWILLLFTAWNSYNQNSAFWDSFHQPIFAAKQD